MTNSSYINNSYKHVKELFIRSDNANILLKTRGLLRDFAKENNDFKIKLNNLPKKTWSYKQRLILTTSSAYNKPFAKLTDLC